MLKENKRYIAVIMIIALLAAMVVMYIINGRRRQAGWADYEEALARQKQLQLSIAAADSELAARKSAAAESIALAAAANLPGVAFYGTNLGEQETGYSLPLIVESLIDQNILDTPVNSVNVLDPHETALQRTYLPVVFICADAWNGDPDSLIDDQKTFIAGRERYIVLGMPTGSRDEMAAVEAKMAAEYGDKFINLREYLSTDGMASINLAIYPEDEAAMAEGRTPPGLLAADGVTLNESGYKLAAFLTYDRMDTLGYFDEVRGAVEEYEAEYEEKAGEARA